MRPYVRPYMPAVYAGDLQQVAEQAVDASQKSSSLVDYLGRFDACIVAFSGGVDSAVVARAAREAVGDHSLAVTGVSDSLAEGELEQAASTAAAIGIEHRFLRTSEFANPRYTANAADRCFHCKTELYTQLRELAATWGAAVILNGANLDDRGDYRPGMRAARDFAVLSPLIECGLTKNDVRAIARWWGLPVWEKPAAPCLSSRVAYGEEVTPERLRMIDRAEQFLRQAGFPIARVRYHRGDLARIEVPLDQGGRLWELGWQQVADEFKSIGFRFVTVDLEGFRSGSLNQLVQIELPE